MKKIILSVIMMLTISFLCVPCTAHAEESGMSEQAIGQEVDGILYDNDADLTYSEVKDISFGGIIGKITAGVKDRLTAPAKMLKAVLIAVILAGVLKCIGESSFTEGRNSGIYSIVCVILIMSSVMPPLAEVLGDALEAVRRTGRFVEVFVPVFTGITIASGNITTAGTYNIAVIGASEVIVRLSEAFLMPAVCIMAALGTAGSVFPGASLESISQFMKKTVTWAMSITMTLFICFVTMKCDLGGKADGVAAKTARMVISGSVPVVGGAVSDAYSTVKSGFGVIHGTVGTAGVFAVILMIAPPVIEIAVYRFVMWAGASFGETVSAAPLVKVMKSIDSGLAVTQSVLICYGVILVLCTGILVRCYT